jgi:hypothetical protein
LIATIALDPKIRLSTLKGWAQSRQETLTGQNIPDGASGPLPELSEFMEEQLRRLVMCGRERGTENPRVDHVDGTRIRNKHTVQAF